jgi:hypothetical protein
VWSEVGERTSSTWTSGRTTLGMLRLTGPAQGISPTPGAMHPHTLSKAMPGSRDEIRVASTRGDLQLDGILVRPFVSRLVLEGDRGARTELVHSAARSPQKVTVGAGRIDLYDEGGREVRVKKDRSGALILPAGGFAIVER